MASARLRTEGAPRGGRGPNRLIARVGRQRVAEVEPLRVVAAERREPLGNAGALHSLRGNAQAEAPAELDRRADDRLVVPARVHAQDERLVALDLVSVQALELHGGRVACS